MLRHPRPDPVGPGQESVWDYPRPPALDEVDQHIMVFTGDIIVAQTHTAFRVLETSHPPTYYLPRVAFAPGVLVASSRTSFCEFKGVASWFDLVVGDRVERDAAWTYRDPSPAFTRLAGAISLYPQRVSRITVDGEVVRAVQGDFYGGWATSKIVGPFKGQVAGSASW